MTLHQLSPRTYSDGSMLNLPLTHPEPVESGSEPGALDVSGVSLKLGGAQVLDDVEVHVGAGRLVALLGPSGCGKTTLLRTISGLERPDAGRVSVSGRDLTGPGRFVPPERRHIGMVFQDWALFPHMSVGRNVGFGLSADERRAGRVEEALELVELPGYGHRSPRTLSGGQQQRVALARALAHRPSVILLDEPFSNLDTALRVQVRADVTTLLRRLEVTALFVTHDQEEAFVLGDEVAVMLDGRIEQQAPPAELYTRPATRKVAGFVGDSNLVPGHAGSRGADTVLGLVPLDQPFRGQVDVLVRPECLEVRDGNAASIAAVEYYGHDAVYILQPDAGPPVRVRILDRPFYRPGDRVDVGYRGGPTVAYPVLTADLTA